MITVEEACLRVRQQAQPMAETRKGLLDALGLVLTREVTADRDSPPFAKALVDGFALRSADRAAGCTKFRVVGQVNAGQVWETPVQEGEALRIMTGAPLPPGADAVVMWERVREEILVNPAGETSQEGDAVPETTTWIHYDASLDPGVGVFPQGREMRRGDVVAAKGSILTPARLGVMAGVGLGEAYVIPQPTVAVVATGDELVEPIHEPGPGQIRNSNSTLLRALTHACGALSFRLRIARDRADDLKSVLRIALASDVLIISGGVSSGDKDLVPEVLQSMGAQTVFHQVRVKPGKPVWFGIAPQRNAAYNPTLVFGLPGNPVSGALAFCLLVRPALEVMAGHPWRGPLLIPCQLAEPYKHRGDRPTYHPARWQKPTTPVDPASRELPAAIALPWAGSGDLLTLTQADGFLVFPEGDADYPAGWNTHFLPLPNSPTPL